MRKIFTLLVLLPFFTFSQVKYNGEIAAGFSMNAGKYYPVHIHTIHGIKVGPYFSTGIGTGLDYYAKLPLYQENMADQISVPVFLNCKGYLPVKGKGQIFLSGDAGGSFGISSELSGIRAFGFMSKTEMDNWLFISLGFGCHQWLFKQEYRGKETNLRNPNMYRN